MGLNIISQNNTYICKLKTEETEMSTSLFRKNIEDIHVPILSGLGESGIVLTNQKDTVSDIPSIMFALETACNRFGANAVYFRYYSDRQTYIPQMYIFDFTDKFVSVSNRKEIHKKMWNGCQVPAYMIVEKTRISKYFGRIFQRLPVSGTCEWCFLGNVGK